jgi:hypothetical protein
LVRIGSSAKTVGVFVAGLACFLSPLPTSGAQSAPDINLKLQELMAKVQSMEPSIERQDVAAKLAQWTAGIKPNKVDDETVLDLISLVDSKDESVVYFAAAALGNLGVRARMASQKLRKRLSQEETCPQLPTSKITASVIRTALKRMRVKVPHPDNCPEPFTAWKSTTDIGLHPMVETA